MHLEDTLNMERTAMICVVRKYSRISDRRGKSVRTYLRDDVFSVEESPYRLGYGSI